MANLYSLMIPRPASIVPVQGQWRITGNTDFRGDLLSGGVPALLSDAFTALDADDGPAGRSSVTFRLTEPETGEVAAESYRLSVEVSGATIESPTPAGLFRGASALAQLIRLAAAAGETAVPCGVVDDSPRFSWRGYMLDCSRHFQPVDTILRLIDVMAFYRMSVLHLHLTDDQGWRLDVPELPELVQVGSKRKDSIRGRGFAGRKWTAGEPHEGHYTADDIRTIVEYAAARFIEVVPEIDVPGHVLSVLAAYPELGCTGGPYEVPWKNGIFPDVLCVGNEAVWDFLDKVVSTVAELFPSKRIHFGGDEVPRNSKWKECPKCRAQRETEGLSGIAGQQALFSRRLAELAKKHGRRGMFWSEACIDGLDIDAAGQFWLIDGKGAYRQLEAGREILFSKHGACYLDMPYSYLPLARSYAWDPARKPGLTPEAESHILGIESPMWTEWIPTEERLHHQSFPRAIALAERGWSDASVRDYRGFEKRLRAHLPVLDSLGIGYAPPEKWNRGFLAVWWRLFSRRW